MVLYDNGYGIMVFLDAVELVTDTESYTGSYWVGNNRMVVLRY